MLVLEKDAESSEQRYFIVEDDIVISAWEYADDATAEYAELRKNGYKVKIVSLAKAKSLGII